MDNTFLPLIFRMRYINRWSLMFNTEQEDLMQHTAECAFLVHFLATIGNRCFEKQYDADKLAVCALFAVACYTLLVPEGFTVAGMPLSFETFTPLNALLILLLFVFGFFLYALLYSITGAMVSRTEDLGSAMAPVMIVNFVAFYSAYFVALIGDGGLKDVFSLIPFTAPFVLPFRLLNESVAWHIPVLALLLLAAAFALIAYATMKIYSASVLYYGQRLKIRDLIKIKL